MKAKHRIPAKAIVPSSPVAKENASTQKPDDEKHHIYSLRFPDTRRVFYIGVAADPYKRFIQHLQLDGTNRDKDAVINMLKKKGKTPLMEVEATCSDRQLAETYEAAYTEYYRNWGHPVTNQVLKLNTTVEHHRWLALYEQKILHRYSSHGVWVHVWEAIVYLFTFPQWKRQSYYDQTLEDYALFLTIQEQHKEGKM